MSKASDRSSQSSSCWVVCAWLAAVIMMALSGQQAHAADFSVHDTGDPVANGAALVGAINAAMHTVEEDDRVLLDPGVHYVLANPDASDPDTGLPVIRSGITIRGGYGSNGELTTIERKAGSPPFRILRIEATIRWVPVVYCTGPEPTDIPPTVRLEYLRIRNGNTVDTAHFGGGILNLDGQLILYRSEVSDNSADFGGGLRNDVYTVADKNFCYGAPVTDLKFVSGNVSIQETTLHNNHALGSGGGVSNATTMRIDHSTINANQGDEEGGGIANGGTLEIANSTVSGNFTTGPFAVRPGDAAAGIQNAGRLTVSFSTVAFNQGSGLANASPGLVTLANTILAGNVAIYEGAGAGPQPFDCSGVLRSLGRNLIGVVDPHSGCTITRGRDDQIGLDRAAPIDAKLLPLAANGGFTQTHALLVGSPAIDRADTTAPACPIDDQRGIMRRRVPADSCDIGAFEKEFLGDCRFGCSVWRVVGVCVNNPLACQKIVIPEIDKLPDFPKFPDCLVDGPGCGPLDFK